MEGIVKTVTRQLKIATPKVVPFVTETIPKQKAILRNKNGKFIEVAPHHLTRELKKFLLESGLEFEYEPVDSKTGRRKIAGISVKVEPLRHTHYDGGVLIRIVENDEMSYDNTNKVVEYLARKGINIAKECVFLFESKEEGACLHKGD